MIKPNSTRGQGHRFDPIGLIRSPFTDKFGIPRQPNLATAAEARLELLPPCDREECFRELEGFSHVWILFLFHAAIDEGWRATVRPPRLGGRKRVGVFASRSPHRPNPIGMSVVPQLGLERRNGRLSLRLGAVDLLDGTPVLDVKPYVPYSDSLPDAAPGYAIGEPVTLSEVEFTEEASAEVERCDPDGRLKLRALIEQVVAQDPRPGYMARYPERQRFGMRLYDLEVKWVMREGRASVFTLEPADTEKP